MSLIWGCFMMNLCIVMDVIQKSAPATTMVMIPGTHPKTLEIYVSETSLKEMSIELTRVTKFEP